MRRLPALACAALLALVLAGCGSDEPADLSVGDSPSSTGPASPTPATATTDPAGQIIEVTIDGDDVTPNGERVLVALGSPVELRVTADAPGEIHVHSSPEQELEYSAGETDLTIPPITVPGIVEVESHALDKVIVQLQVQ